MKILEVYRLSRRRNCGVFTVVNNNNKVTNNGNDDDDNAVVDTPMNRMVV